VAMAFDNLHARHVRPAVVRRDCLLRGDRVRRALLDRESRMEGGEMSETAKCCPKCGERRERRNEGQPGNFVCGSWVSGSGPVVEGKVCLGRQVAQRDTQIADLLALAKSLIEAEPTEERPGAYAPTCVFCRAPRTDTGPIEHTANCLITLARAAVAQCEEVSA
jgi:hypothetical protein